jgi:hypothetical protein
VYGYVGQEDKRCYADISQPLPDVSQPLLRRR